MVQICYSRLYLDLELFPVVCCKGCQGGMDINYNLNNLPFNAIPAIITKKYMV